MVYQQLGTVKKKLPIWAWVLVIVGFASVVILATLHFVGIIDLTFIGTGFVGVFMWASVDVINALLVTILYTAFWTLVCYVVIKYFVGQKVIAPQTQSQYQAQVGLSQPTMQYTPPPEKKEETAK